MNKNTWLTWSLISILFGSFACLPFDHTCILGTAGSTQSPEAQPTYPTTHAAVRSLPTGTPGLREQVRPEKSDVCLACLYSRTLLRNDSKSEVAVARTVTAAPVCALVFLYQFTDLFQSTLKRGPPATPLS